MTVAHVEVEDAAPTVEQRFDLIPELREIRGVQRRLDLDVADPVLQPTRAILDAQAVHLSAGR